MNTLMHLQLKIGCQLIKLCHNIIKPFYKKEPDTHIKSKQLSPDAMHNY